MTATHTLTTKLIAVSDLIRLTRQYGTALLLCPTLWALLLATGGAPPAKLLVIFILGSFLMRSAGCAINDIADREFDRQVERTKTRPLADGRLDVREATVVFLSLSALAFVLVLFLNPLTILLSMAGLLLAATYPLIKRVSSLPQAFLGMAFGWGAVMAWAAATGEVAAAALLIFLANVFWSTAYDTVYALMDRDDDLKAGVKSTAILFGRHVYTAVTLLYVGMALTLVLTGWTLGLGPIYYTGIAAALTLFLAITVKIKKNPTREAAFRGFVANVTGGAIILLAIALDSAVPF
ncbi:MAG: 4-hydroxybenzoate octaprenyltransferase [Thermodesulfobacteriota bacterium]